MQRITSAVLFLIPTLALAQTDILQGKIKKLDIDRTAITLTRDGKDHEYFLVEQTKVFGSDAKSVKEANLAVVQAIKESGAMTAKAIEQFTIEQKRSTNAQRETACLSDPTLRNRADAREFCKRMSRDDR